jgi:nucleotide-binding universal stress UspA family protein
MAKPILVGFKPGGNDRPPVAFAAAAARLTGAPLVIATFASEELAAAVGPGLVEEEVFGPAGAALDKVRDELAPGTDSEVRVMHGHSAPHALHKAAEELDAGLLVIGSASHGKIGRLLPGSTATRLLHGAPCPLAIVPHGWHPGEGLTTIGVAYVDSPEGRSALHGAVALARAGGAKLRVLSAGKPHGFHDTQGGGDAMTPATTYGDIGSTIRAATERAVAAATRAENGAGVEIEPDVSVGDPADFLIGASAHVDLLVCGSRGYGPARSVLLGGVTRRVTAEAHCPVIVLPRGTEAALQALL